jgi:hypothetical protein
MRDATLTTLYRLDKTALAVVSSFDEARKEDEAYWIARTPQERIRQIELLRRMNYGLAATKRLQRVFEFTQR